MKTLQSLLTLSVLITLQAALSRIDLSALANKLVDHLIEATTLTPGENALVSGQSLVGVNASLPPSRQEADKALSGKPSEAPRVIIIREGQTGKCTKVKKVVHMNGLEEQEAIFVTCQQVKVNMEALEKQLESLQHNLEIPLPPLPLTPAEPTIEGLEATASAWAPIVIGIRHHEEGGSRI